MDVNISIEDKAILEWNNIADEGNQVNGRNHELQIKAFVIGKVTECTIDDIHKFICQDLLD
jgi:hypothetical protein